MSKFEIGPCSIEEYHAGEKTRIMEESLEVEELYLAMFALKQQATKRPSRVTALKKQNPGLYKVEFSILNADLQVDLETEGVFRDGYWQKVSSQGIKFGERLVNGIYFKDYGDDVDGGLQALMEDALEGSLAFDPVRERELVPA